MKYNLGIQVTPEGEKVMIANFVSRIENKELAFKINKPEGEWEPVNFGTATTGMKDWIGNIREVREIPEKGETLCAVEGVYEGKMRTVPNIKLRGNISKIGERVMVTEHMNIAGGFDMLATKKRILDMQNKDFNWINIGWSNKEECRYLRIDPYTGETKECFGPSRLR